MDRLSTTGSLRNWQSTNIVKKYDFGLCDAQRSHHPSLTEYTFFSPVHHSYSRLDYFLVSNSLISNNPETEICGGKNCSLYGEEAKTSLLRFKEFTTE